jgi:hypothetical protein
MRKIIILLSLVFITQFYGFAQKSNLIFFTEQGEPFYVIINGIKQNGDPRTNVRITDLISPSYKCKIIFKNTSLPQLDKTVYINPGTEATYVIKKNNKGKWVINWMNEIAVNNAPANNNSYVFSTEEPVNPEPQVNVVPPQQNTTVQQQTTTQQPTGNNPIIGVSVTDPNTGTNFNLNIGNINQPNTTSTTTTTTTTTSSTTTTGTNVQPPAEPRIRPNQPYNNRNNQRQVVDAVPGYYGPYGCNNPMSNQSFADAKKSISSKSFESSKITVAKQVISNNCLTVAQVKEIVRLFDFESSRLEIAKFAYRYTYDKGNYYQLNDAFDFESSIDELNSYIK